MATHPNVEAELKVGENDMGAIQDSERLVAASVRRTRRQNPVSMDEAARLPFRPMPEILPVSVIPETLASTKPRRKLRRVMTHEEGRALEMLGHAVDYLTDQYLYEGDESEIIRMDGLSTEAAQILISARQQILQSLPLTETRMQRLWDALFHRKARQRPAPTTDGENRPIAVVRLSSSR